MIHFSECCINAKVGVGGQVYLIIHTTEPIKSQINYSKLS